jgi:16S rRNA (guanine527-N7)-methyltransferase
MDKIKINELKKLNIELNDTKLELFDKYTQLFLEKNSCVNLISKNDEQFLFEKHIFDSLAINKFLKPKSGQTLLDFGTGGGFPSVPLAMLYEELEVTALDSIRKKITVIEEMKQELNLCNLKTVCERVEKINEQYDFVTSRAVASMDLIIKYAAPKLKNGGYFIAFKSKKVKEEIAEASKTIKLSGLKLIDIIEYSLPLTENHERNLVIFKKL